MTDITTVAELIRLGHINDVRFLEFSARVRDEPDDSYAEDDVSQEIQLSLRKTDSAIEFRLSTKISTRLAEYEATAATQVEVDEGRITEAVVHDFAARIGFTVVYPYIREVVHSASSRLRVENIVIPLVDPAEIRLELIDDVA